MKFDFKKVFKNKFQDNDEKSFSGFKNKVPATNDLKAVETHESHPTAWELTKPQL